jgi:hypothetical protein
MYATTVSSITSLTVEQMVRRGSVRQYFKSFEMRFSQVWLKRQFAELLGMSSTISFD